MKLAKAIFVPKQILNALCFNRSFFTLAINGIQMFAFHANVNNDISQVEPGNFSKDFTEPTDGNLWSYYNSELQLKIGDEVNYWIFVQYEKLGYRKDNLKWKVTGNFNNRVMADTIISLTTYLQNW